MIMFRRIILSLSFILPALGLPRDAAAQDYLSPVPMVAPKERVKTPPPQPAPQRSPAAAPAPVPAPTQAAGAQQAGPRPQTIGDWTVTCSSAPTRACVVAQRRVDSSNGVVLIAMELMALRNGAKIEYVVTTTVPLGLRTAPLRITSAEGRELMIVPGFACIPAGCIYKMELTPALLRILENQDALVAPVLTIEGQQLRFGLKGNGLREAVQQVERSLRAT